MTSPHTNRDQESLRVPKGPLFFYIFQAKLPCELATAYGNPCIPGSDLRGEDDGLYLRSHTVLRTPSIISTQGLELG